MTIDDSALIHARTPYDPQKAREYYLRTRKLKGRRTARVVEPKGNGRPHAVAVPAHKKSSKGRNAELMAQKAALEKRLDRLRDILAQKVKAAKRRSGVEDKSPKKSSQEKAAKSERGKNDKPLTAAEKHKKAAKARADYKKEHGGDKGDSVSNEIAQLKKQIADIKARIAAAIQDAQKQHQSTHQTAPKGR